MKNLEKRLKYDRSNTVIRDVENLIFKGAKKLWNKEVTDEIVAEFDRSISAYGINNNTDAIVSIDGVNTDIHSFKIVCEESFVKSCLEYTEKLNSNNIVSFDISFNLNDTSPKTYHNYTHSCTAYHEMFNMGIRPSIKDKICVTCDDCTYTLVGEYDEYLVKFWHTIKKGETNYFVNIVNVVDKNTLIKKLVSDDEIYYAKTRLGRKEGLPTANTGVYGVESYLNLKNWEIITLQEYNELLNKSLESRRLMSDIDEVRNGESR